MSEVEITHMTSKGQVVIPLDIRKEIKASEGTVFAVFGTGDTIMLKKIYKPSKEQAIKEWKELVEEGNKRARALGIKEEDVVKIIHKRRGVPYDY